MHEEVYWRRLHGGVGGEERPRPASAARGWEQAEGAFAGFSCPVAGLHAGGTSALPSRGPDASHRFSYRSSTLLGTPAIRLQAALCFCQCWTWHALRRGRPPLRGSAAKQGARGSSRDTAGPRPSLGVKQRQGQTPAPHSSGRWGGAGIAEH